MLGRFARQVFPAGFLVGQRFPVVVGRLFRHAPQPLAPSASYANWFPGEGWGTVHYLGSTTTSLVTELAMKQASCAW